MEPGTAGLRARLPSALAKNLSVCLISLLVRLMTVLPGEYTLCFCNVCISSVLMQSSDELSYSATATDTS